MFPIFDYWKPIEKYINVSSLHGPSDTCLILQVQHNLRRGGGGEGRGGYKCRCLWKYQEGAKEVVFCLLNRQSLRWKIFKVNSRESVFVSHQNCYRKARLLQKNLLLKIIKYTHHPKKTTPSLLKQHYTVLECYNAYLDKEKQQAWVIYHDDCSGEVSSEQVLI